MASNPLGLALATAPPSWLHRSACNLGVLLTAWIQNAAEGGIQGESCQPILGLFTTLLFPASSHPSAGDHYCWSRGCKMSGMSSLWPPHCSAWNSNPAQNSRQFRLVAGLRMVTQSSACHLGHWTETSDSGLGHWLQKSVQPGTARALSETPLVLQLSFP